MFKCPHCGAKVSRGSPHLCSAMKRAGRQQPVRPEDSDSGFVEAVAGGVIGALLSGGDDPSDNGGGDSSSE